MTYTKKLKSAVEKSGSTLCVGLDPNLALLPGAIKNEGLSSPKKVEKFLKQIIDVTAEFCAAFKPNLGFFEALGADGWDTFEAVLDYIPDEKIVIADAKRGDISSTAEHYAKAFFDQFNVDALTLNPLMGFETLDPFLTDASKAVYVLTLTSNPGAEDILLKKLSGGKTVSGYISQRLSEKQHQIDTAIGMVVGATKADQLKPVISNFAESPLLIPGVGKQGGSVKALADALNNHSGIPLINSSRSILYAGSETTNWEQAVSESAEKLKRRLLPVTERYVL